MIDWTTATEVEARIDRIRTQYRESPNLIGVMRAMMEEASAAAEKLAAIASAFDLDEATGDQLTIIGKWLGWPRTHCQGQLATFFGFETQPPVQWGGFCGDPEAEWDCLGTDAETLFGFNSDDPGDQCNDYFPVAGFGGDGFFWTEGLQRFRSYTFDDDDLYRKWLKARQRTIKKDYRREALIDAAAEIYGAGDVIIVAEELGEVVLCLTREFTADERAILHMAENVLPVAPGVRLTWAESAGAPLGFGDGWGEMCDAGFYRVIRDPLDRYIRSSDFGFGPQDAGLCEGFFSA